MLWTQRQLHFFISEFHGSKTGPMLIKSPEDRRNFGAVKLEEVTWKVKLSLRWTSSTCPVGIELRFGWERLHFSTLFVQCRKNNGAQCEYVIVHTIWGGSPVILWVWLCGKPKWLPLKFGYHDVMHTSSHYTCMPFMWVLLLIFNLRV